MFAGHALHEPNRNTDARWAAFLGLYIDLQGRNLTVLFCSAHVQQSSESSRLSALHKSIGPTQPHAGARPLCSGVRKGAISHCIKRRCHAFSHVIEELSPREGVGGVDPRRQDGLGRDADEHAQPVRPAAGTGHARPNTPLLGVLITALGHNKWSLDADHGSGP